MSKSADTFSPEETAKRRDEVIRRMANTPPRPKPTSHHHPKKEKKADVGRAAHKRRADREG